MTSLVPGLGKQKLHFCQLWRDKNLLRAGPELQFENYQSVQHRLQFSEIKMGAKISFHRHFKVAGYSFQYFSRLRPRLHGSGQIFARTKTYTVPPCVYTGPAELDGRIVQVWDLKKQVNFLTCTVPYLYGIM